MIQISGIGYDYKRGGKLDEGREDYTLSHALRKAGMARSITASSTQ